MFLASFLKGCLRFLSGAMLGQLFYNLSLNGIPFPLNMEKVLSVLLSVLLGLGNVISIQMRCISALLFPMCCGKPGRAVIKAMVLTFIVAGPITNMGLNAREVVRVFTCTNQLSSDLFKVKHTLIARPTERALLGAGAEVKEFKDTFRSLQDVVSPITSEIEGIKELQFYRKKGKRDGNSFDDVDQRFRSTKSEEPKDIYQKGYLKKLYYRYKSQMFEALKTCVNGSRAAYRKCRQLEEMTEFLCMPLKLGYVCDFGRIYHDLQENRVDPGLGEGYRFLIKVVQNLTSNLTDVKLQYKRSEMKELFTIQDAKETSVRIIHAFDGKATILKWIIITVNVCMSLVFLRIVTASTLYHDLYLTRNDYDNVYITGYFKRIDCKRRRKKKYNLLPLKKMERIKYTDVFSTEYRTPDHGKLLSQILNIMLEAITATTFLMLDRLFYEALDVVRQNAAVDNEGSQDMDIEVEGTGIIASILRRIISEMKSPNYEPSEYSGHDCLPRPRLMPVVFYLKIYGGYICILMLIFLNPYTGRLRRLVCAYFYPRREKLRILHLYNDILKKRMKLQKTLRQTAVQGIRAHYLTSENLLSLRIKYPTVLGWLDVFPAARMCCLICGETEPRDYASRQKSWRSCNKIRCPFVYCYECWREVGRHCLACDPSLAELSDIHSESEDDPPKY